MEPQLSQLSKKEKKATEDAEEDGPHLSQRRGFDSDEDMENMEAASSGSITGSRCLVPQQEQTEPQMTEEEKNIKWCCQQKLMTETLLVPQMKTSIT